MPLAAAIVPAVVRAGIGAAGKAYAAGQQKKAAGKALKAQQAAEAQRLALQREQQAKAEGLYRPVVQGGYAALDQLLQRVTGGAGQSQARPATQPPARPQTQPYRPPTGAPVGAMSGRGQPLGSMPGGLRPQAPDAGPGPAPAGKKWVHGPEGYILTDDRPAVSFRDAVGGLGGQAKTPTGGFAGGSPTGAPVGAMSARPGPAGALDPTTTMDWSNARGSMDTFQPTSGFAGGDAQDAVAGGSGSDTLAPQGGGPDWQAYLNDNPDVAQWSQQAVAQGAYASPEEAAQHHYQQHGQTENRALPMTPSTAYSYDAAQEPAQADPNAPPDYMNMARPEAPEAPTFRRPQDMQFRDYGDGPQFSWDPSQIAKDPGFLFETAETTKGVNAGAAARGKLRSGDAAKALQDRLFGVAHTYGNDYFNRALQGYNANRNAFQDNRNYGTGLTQWRQNRRDNIFGDDRAYDTARWQDQRTYGDARFDAERNYQTNRYDTQTNNLFNIANMGQNAIGGTVNAGSQYANNAGNIYQNTANARADAAYQRADANAGLVGSIAGAVGNVFSNWGGGARSTGGQTVGQAWNTSFGGGWQTPHNPTFVNRPSDIRVF